MKRIATIAVAAAVGFCLTIGLAAADRKAVSDEAGDSTLLNYDIVKGIAKHKGERRLVHIVRFADPLTGNFNNLQISLLINRDRDRDCEREFHFSDGPGRVPMVRCGIGDTAKFGRVTQPNARSLKLTFKRAGIVGANRDLYKWRLRVRACPGGPPCDDDADALPDDGAAGLRYIRHKLD